MAKLRVPVLKVGNCSHCKLRRMLVRVKKKLWLCGSCLWSYEQEKRAK